MIFLYSNGIGDKRYLLSEKQKYSVGRAQADIPLLDDNSISREHAIIHVSADAVQIEDPGSKYGVYLNANDIKLNHALPKKESMAMQVGDIVRFGRLTNIWRLEKIVINCCTSTIDANELPALEQLLRIVNGNLQRVWNEFCTHLVMPNVTITIKGKPLNHDSHTLNEQMTNLHSVQIVLQSMVQGVPIVTPAYWTAYVECVRENRQQLPNVNDFVPEINEQFIRKTPNLLHVNLRRQRLFQGKTFVFMTRRHMAAFESIIKLAHGNCDYLEKNRFVKKDLLKKEIIPVVCKTTGQSQATQDINNVVDYIGKHGRRAIPDTELSLAILHCDTVRYCNPDFKMQKCFEVHTIDLTERDGEVIVEETPEPIMRASDQVPASEICLPESIGLTHDTVSNRRIDSSAVYSECAGNAECEMEEVNDQMAQPSTSGMNLGKRRRRLPSDDAPGVEQNVEKKSKLNDGEPNDIEPTINSEPSHTSNLSGFLATQNRFKKPNAEAPVTQQSQQTQIAAAERRKRAIDALKSLSDDEDNNNDADENPFAFAGRKTAKRAKGNRFETVAPTNDADDDVDGGFNFSIRQPQRNRVGASQRKNSTSSPTNSSADATSVLLPVNRTTAEKSMRLLYIKPVETSSDGWLSRAFKKDVSIADGAENAAAWPGKIKIKEEKLEEWEMTEEEKKCKWLKSLANAIEIKKFNVAITRRCAADETDGNVSALNGTVRNFKKFVKVKINEIKIQLKFSIFQLNFLSCLLHSETELHYADDCGPNEAGEHHHQSICPHLNEITTFRENTKSLLLFTFYIRISLLLLYISLVLSVCH